MSSWPLTSSAEIKNSWGFPSTSSYVFMVPLLSTRITLFHFSLKNITSDQAPFNMVLVYFTHILNQFSAMQGDMHVLLTGF
jgi:hypothetical protein